MKRSLLVLAFIAGVTIAGVARTRTTQHNLTTDAVPVERIVVAPDDSTLTVVNPDAVTLRGYSKRASDSKESFFITNHLEHRISAVRLLMRYTALDGSMLHERTITVPVTLNAGATQLVSIKSFDVQRLFYYYGGPKPRKSATPFKVAARLLGYDIPIGY